MESVNVDLDIVSLSKSLDDCNTRNDSIKSGEDYIEVEKLIFEQLKSRLYDDVLSKVLETIKKELPTQITVNDRNSVKKRKLENMEELVLHLKSEVEFLRNEIKTKNFVINNLVSVNTILHNEQKISHTNSGINLTHFRKCQKFLLH